MSKRYEVSTTSAAEGIGINIVKGFSGYNVCWVRQPNIIERLFRITFDTKLIKAIEKAQNRCDRLNALDEQNKRKLKKFKRGRIPTKT